MTGAPGETVRGWGGVEMRSTWPGLKKWISVIILYEAKLRFLSRPPDQIFLGVIFDILRPVIIALVTNAIMTGAHSAPSSHYGIGDHVSIMP